MMRRMVRSRTTGVVSTILDGAGAMIAVMIETVMRLSVLSSYSKSGSNSVKEGGGRRVSPGKVRWDHWSCSSGFQTLLAGANKFN